MGASEKRSGRRKAVALRIKLRYDGVDAFIARFATNISRAGVFIRSKQPKEPGTVIHFELLLADGSSVVAGRGEVRWTRAFDANNPKAPFGMGIAFTHLGDNSQKMIERVVEHRASREKDFEPTRIPHHLAVKEAVPSPIAGGDGSVSTRHPLAPETKKRPRATLEEVMAKARTDAPPDADPDADVEGALKRARQLTEAGDASDALLDELESGGAVVQATPREASEKLAALFGGVPMPARRTRNRTPERAGPLADPGTLLGLGVGETAAAPSAPTEDENEALVPGLLAPPDENEALAELESVATEHVAMVPELLQKPEPIPELFRVPDENENENEDEDEDEDEDDSVEKTMALGLDDLDDIDDIDDIDDLDDQPVPATPEGTIEPTIDIGPDELQDSLEDDEPDERTLALGPGDIETSADVDADRGRGDRPTITDDVFGNAGADAAMRADARPTDADDMLASQEPLMAFELDGPEAPALDLDDALDDLVEAPSTATLDLDSALDDLEPDSRSPSEGFDIGEDDIIDDSPLAVDMPSSFIEDSFDSKTVARPGLAAALADASELLERNAHSDEPSLEDEHQPIAEPAADPEPAPESELGPAFAAEPGTSLAGAAHELDASSQKTRMVDNLASPFALGVDEPELEDDIEAALDFLIPSDSSPALPGVRPAPPARSDDESDLGVGDRVGFHHVPATIERDDDDDDDDGDLFPEIADRTAVSAPDDYLLAFESGSDDRTSVEPDATFARAQAAIDQVIGESEPAPEPEINLDDHIEFDEPGGEQDPTFISDMPSAALASDLVLDADNQLGREPIREVPAPASQAPRPSIDALLPPEEPFMQEAADGPVHGVGDFFDPQPLSEELPVETLLANAPSAPGVAVPPPIPRPPPPPIEALRPPDTLPPGGLDAPELLGQRIKAPGMPPLPEDEIEIDLGEFDSSPAVVSGQPIPDEVTEEPQPADEPRTKRKSLFGRLFRKD